MCDMYSVVERPFSIALVPTNLLSSQRYNTLAINVVVNRNIASCLLLQSLDEQIEVSRWCLSTKQVGHHL